MLDASEIIDELEQPQLYQIEIYDQVTSTNTLSKEAANRGSNEGVVIVANKQTEGRGRLGRAFHSPEDTGVYFSMLLRPKIAMKDVNRLTTIAAVAVSEAIEEVLEVNTQIKWVNDIYIRDKKVCGILTEGNFSSDGLSMNYVVVGIGINVRPPRDGFPQELKSIATSLLEDQEETIQSTVDIRNRIVASVINHFFHYYKGINSGHIDYITSYRNRSMLDGRAILVIKPGREIPAKAMSVDENCHLIVEYEDGTREHLFTGEVSIRMK